MVKDKNDVIIGQECICPKGMGRVSKVKDGVAGNFSICVDTYIKNIGSCYDACNVTLIDPILTDKKLIKLLAKLKQ